jgi:hypothetical protein
MEFGGAALFRGAAGGLKHAGLGTEAAEAPASGGLRLDQNATPAIFSQQAGWGQVFRIVGANFIENPGGFLRDKLPNQQIFSKLRKGLAWSINVHFRMKMAFFPKNASPMASGGIWEMACQKARFLAWLGKKYGV